MQYFVTIVQRNSFTEVAEDCFISQSAISQQIHEEHLVFVQSASSCLRMLRDCKGVSEKALAEMMPKRIQEIRDQAAEELKRRALPSTIKRFVRTDYNEAKKPSRQAW